MNSAEAKKQLLDLISATQALFPDQHWEPVSEPETGPCALDDGSSGSVWTYTINSTTRGPLDDYEKVQAFWQSRGIRTHQLANTVPDDGERGLVGYPDDVNTIGFYRSTIKNQIDGESVCFADS